MSIEKVDYPFLKEQSLKEYIRTLQDISSRNYAPMLICMLPRWIKKILLRYKTERGDKE